MSINGLKVIKKINLKTSIEKYLECLEKENFKEYKEVFEFYDHELGRCENFKTIMKFFSINDQSDVLIRLMPRFAVIKKM